MRKSERIKKLLTSAVFFMASISFLNGCSSGSSSPAPQTNCTAPAAPAGVSATMIVSAPTGSDTTALGACFAFKTITAALTTSSSGDVVWVAPGTYDAANGEVFPISVPAGVSLIGATASKGAGTTPTLIKGHGGPTNGWYSALHTGASTTISGFEFDDTAYTIMGSGIYSDNVTFSATNNTFLSSFYGGITLDNGGNPSIQNNDFQSDSYGVYSGCTGTTTIQNNTFDNVYIPININVGNTIIKNNTFTESGWATVGIQISSGNSSIQNNTFSATGYTYGALLLWGITSPVVRGNTFNAGPVVKANNAAAPDLGTSSLTPGSNVFSSITGTVINHLSSATIYAIGNIWPSPGTPSCGAQIITSGTGTVVWGSTPGDHCP